MLNDNKISEIKLILESLSKEIETLNEMEMISHLKWEDIFSNADMLKQKLNTLRIEQERHFMSGRDDEIKRLSQTVIELRRTFSALQLNISDPRMPDLSEPPPPEAVKEKAPVVAVEKVPVAAMEDVLLPEAVREGAPVVAVEKVPVAAVEDVLLPEAVREEVSVVAAEDVLLPEAVKEEMSVAAVEDVLLPEDDLELELLDDFPVYGHFSDATSEPAWMTDERGPYVEDLNHAITLNDKIYFINELFLGDGEQYRLSIQRLNDFVSMKEALEYLRGAFPEWDESSPQVYRLYMILRRRYNE